MKTEKENPHEDSARTLGEHAIIELMRNFFEPMPDVAVPFGDDVSAVPVAHLKSEVAVLKTDMLVATTDIPVSMGMWEAARKAVVMNVSDFAAKGVQPRAILVSLGLPRNLKREDIVDLAKGLNAGAREYGAYIVGGDTGEASDLIIAVCVYGAAVKDSLMLRSGAKPGDILAVTGLFGRSAAGLRLLLDNKCRASNALRKALVDSTCMPEARLREGLELQHLGAVTSSIDSSDGLAWCLHELAAQSGVGFKVSKVPFADDVKEFAKLNGYDPLELTLYGGEEYELVLTVNPKEWQAAQAAVSAVGGKLLRIGEATVDRQIVLEVSGVKQEIQARGYEHFKG